MHLAQTLRHYCIDFPLYIAHRFQADGCQRSAGSLTYMSLFAIVPLMTVTFSLFSAIPAFKPLGERVRTLIFDYFVPAASGDIQRYVERFTHQTHKLTTVGFVLLALTAFLMLRNIEKTFNAIWNTRGNRRGISGFLLYWAMLSMGPLLLGAGFLVSTYLLSIKVLVGPVKHGPLLDLLPWLTEACAFTLLFFIVPNCRVPFRHALAGGVLSALLFEAAKIGFAVLVSRTSYELVYGAFATVPLFLMWIYLCWLLLLAGAEFVRALSGFGDSLHDQPDLLLALAMLALFREQHRAGRAINDETLLSRRWKPSGRPVSRERWDDVRNRLLHRGIIYATDDGSYVLGQDLDTLTLFDLASAFPDARLAWPEPGSTSPDWQLTTFRLLETEQERRRVSLSIPLNQLFGVHHAADTGE